MKLAKSHALISTPKLLAAQIKFQTHVQLDPFCTRFLVWFYFILGALHRLVNPRLFVGQVHEW
jgi:hypothetical protein